jgi:hypothetical protein
LGADCRFKVDALPIWGILLSMSEKGPLVADLSAVKKVGVLQIRATRAQCPKGPLSLTYWQLTRLMCCKFGRPALNVRMGQG